MTKTRTMLEKDAWRLQKSKGILKLLFARAAETASSSK